MAMISNPPPPTTPPPPPPLAPAVGPLPEKSNIVPAAMLALLKALKDAQALPLPVSELNVPTLRSPLKTNWVRPAG
jgi:hypothetical protein